LSVVAPSRGMSVAPPSSPTGPVVIRKGGERGNGAFHLPNAVVMPGSVCVVVFRITTPYAVQRERGHHDVIIGFSAAYDEASSPDASPRPLAMRHTDNDDWYGKMGTDYVLNVEQQNSWTKENVRCCIRNGGELKEVCTEEIPSEVMFTTRRYAVVLDMRDGRGEGGGAFRVYRSDDGSEEGMRVLGEEKLSGRQPNVVSGNAYYERDELTIERVLVDEEVPQHFL